MKFGALRRHWDRLSRRDALWAVLTHPDKRDGRWQVEEFFHSGVGEIDGVLARAGTLGLGVSRERALDFGCGVGRLTQAMAGHFEHVDGVDISAAMVRAAENHNRHLERCHYQVNLREDLSIFADGIFDFVYSALVLQHMEPRYAKNYIAEFLRVLAPNGLLVFQLPSHRVGVSLSGEARATSVSGPLPPAACRALFSSDATALDLRAQELKPVRVTVVNQSSFSWPALANPRSRFQIAVANRWLTVDGALVQRDDARASLPHDVAPGTRAEVVLYVTAPGHTGDYRLELDLVQEDVCWFRERGSGVLLIPCRVAGGLPGPPSILGPAETVPPPPPPPFRERHPRVFHVLRITRARDAYWLWRRGLDRVKVTRDAAVMRWVHPVLNVARRLLNWWVRRPFAPVMEMHCVPRAEVTAIVADGLARVVDIEETVESGGFHSCRYWITKAPT